MKDYSTGKIYAIRSAQTDEIYIGSTIQPLCVRMAGHREKYKQHLNGKGDNTTSLKILQFEDAYIELLENFPCSCREELNKREGELMRENKKCINKCIAGRSPTQYYQENKDNILSKHKQYREENQDKIVAYKQQYYEENKDTIEAQKQQYYKENKDKILAKNKQYREENRDKLSVKSKQYREENKDKISQYFKDNKDKSQKHYKDNKLNILAKQKQYYDANKDKLLATIECACGGKTTYINKSRHEKSLKHQEYMNLHKNTK